MIRLLRRRCEVFPGFSMDEYGRYHVDVATCLEVDGIPNTRANRRRWARRELPQLRKELPRVVLIAHLEGVS